MSMERPRRKADGGNSRSEKIEEIDNLLTELREGSSISRDQALGLVEDVVIEVSAVDVARSEATREDVSQKLRVLSKAFAEEDEE